MITLYCGIFDKFDIYIYIYIYMHVYMCMCVCVMRIPVHYERKVRNGDVPMDKTKVIKAVDTERLFTIISLKG